jgi:GT2 family glycosyltransferase
MRAATRVTVFMPTYEPRPEHIKAALDSLWAQTVDWELFIHDDASQTDVFKIVEPYLSDPRVTYRRSEERLGLAGNWDACRRMGTGAYVQYLFQDDLWEPNYLATAMNALDQYPEAGFVSMGHRYLCEGVDTHIESIYKHVLDCRTEWLQDGLVESKKFLPFWLSRGLRPNVIGEPSYVMIKRGLMEELGNFRDDLPQCVDIEYWVRAMLLKDFVVCTQNMGSFRVHPEGASAKNRKKLKPKTDRIKLILQYCLGNPLLLIQTIMARFCNKP